MSLMLTMGDIKSMENSARDIIDQWHTTITIMQPLPLDNQPNYDKLLREFTGEMLYEKILIQAERKDIVNNYTNDLSPSDTEYGENDNGRILYAIPNIIPMYDANGMQTGVKQFKPHPESVIAIDDTSDRYHIISMRDRIGETLIMIERYTGQMPDCTEPVIISKVITTNGIFNACDDGVTGYSSITVEVPTCEDENEELKGQIDLLNTQIDELQVEVDNKQNEINDLQAEIKILQDDADTHLEQINALQNEVNNLQTEIDGKQNEINNLQAEVGRLNNDLNYANNKTRDIIELQYSYMGKDTGNDNGNSDAIDSVDINLAIIEHNTSEVYEAGKKSQYDEFWDNFQDYGKRTSYISGFAGFGWTKETFKPKYVPITFSGDCWYKSRKMFEYFGVRDYDKLETNGIDLTPDIVDFSNANNLSNTFYGATFRSVTADISNATSFGGMFGGNDGGAIKYITLTTSDKTAAFLPSVFSYRRDLIELIFTEGSVIKGTLDVQHSAKLNKRSITSIINALSSATSGTTATFSKTAVNNAFGNIESDEWLSLIETKPNWIIALV